MERDVEILLQKEAKKRGGAALKWVSPGNAGVPDRILILPPGKIYFVETKDDKGKTRKIQTYVHRRLAAMGCEVKVLRGKEDVRRFFEEIDGR